MEEKEQQLLLDKVKAAAKAEVEVTLKAWNEEGEKKIDAIVEKRTSMFKELPVEKLKKVVEDMDEANKAVADLKAKFASNEKSATKESFLIERIKEVFPDLKKSLDEGKKNFNFKLENKVQTVSDFGAGVIRGFRELGVNFPAVPELLIMDLISTMAGGVGSNPLSWIERVQKPVAGDVDSLTPLGVAEEGTKPTLGWTWVENSVTSKTIAAIVPVTKQSIYNYAQLEQEIRAELIVLLAQYLEQQIINGDGTGQNLRGINYYAKAFDAGSFAGQIPNANEYDVLVAAATQVLIRNYVPTVALINHISKGLMVMSKNANGTYVLPPFSTNDGLNVYGLKVYSTNQITDDNFLVGDFKKYLYNQVEPITIEIGLINDDFEKNIWRIRGELQGMGRVKAHDTYAFVKGDFSVAKGLLIAP